MSNWCTQSVRLPCVEFRQWWFNVHVIQRTSGIFWSIQWHVYRTVIVRVSDWSVTTVCVLRSYKKTVVHVQQLPCVPTGSVWPYKIESCSCVPRKIFIKIRPKTIFSIEHNLTIRIEDCMIVNVRIENILNQNSFIHRYSLFKT